MGKNDGEKQKKQIKIISIIAISCLVLLCILLLVIINQNGNINNSNKAANSNTDLSNSAGIDETIMFDSSDIEEVQNKYLPLFIAYNEDNVSVLNYLATAVDIKAENYTSYSTYEEDPTAIIYNKNDIDTTISEMFGKGATKTSIVNTFDSTNNVYVTHNSYEATGYNITSSEANTDSSIAEFDVEYYEFSNEDYNKYESDYMSSHNTSKYAKGEGVDPKLYEDIRKDYETQKEKKKLKIKVAINSNYTYSKYRLISIEQN